MEQKLSDTLVKAIDRSNPFMQNLQLASRFNKLIDESGGGADLEDNKIATIDVSTYTEPVEVTPSEGKDGMKKATVSLSNIPSGVNMLYAWMINNSGIIYLNVDIPLNDNLNPDDIKHIAFVSTGATIEPLLGEGDTYDKVSDTEFTITYETGEQTIIDVFARDVTKDVEVWNAPPEVETTKQAIIDVSTYDPTNKPVITPTAGKQSMGSVEVTLDNVPSGGSATAYAWQVADSRLPSNVEYTYISTSVAPANMIEASATKAFFGNLHAGTGSIENLVADETYTRTSDTEFTLSWEESGTTVIQTFTRDSTKDLVFWS